MGSEQNEKRPRGRPSKFIMPEPIDAPPDEVGEVLMQTPPRSITDGGCHVRSPFSVD